MAKKFADLSEKEKNNFYARLKELGIDPGTVPENVVADGSLRLHPDEALTNVPTYRVEVKDLAHLKHLFGVTNQVFAEPGKDAHIKYPAPLSNSRVKLLSTGRKELTEQAITAEESQAVRAAMEAYVNGDSSKVPEHLVTLANTLNFPMSVRAMAAQDITISAPFPVSQSMIFGTVTIEPGGYFEIIGDASINAQLITVESAS